MCAHTSGIGVNRTGAFAEYISLPMANVWVHNPDIDQRIATIFDPFGNATHAALQFELLGEDVLITGAGPIGCMAGAICKHAGARHVVVTDMNPYRLDLAIKMGATRAVDVSQESLTDVMEDLGMKEGFDVGLEMSGSEAAFNQMLASLSHGGKISMLGLPSNEMCIDWNRVVFNMLTIKGIYGREMYESWYKMAVMIQNGLDLSPVITHEYGIDKFQQGFDVMRSGQSGKVILDWT
jgi:threonine 3-dehydrogenase